MKDKEKTKFMKTISLILNILIIIFLIGTIYVFLWRIFGNSPTDFQVISWVVGLFSVVIFKLFTFTYNMNREISELKTGVKNGFKRIKEDIQEIKTLIKKNEKQ